MKQNSTDNYFLVGSPQPAQFQIEASSPYATILRIEINTIFVTTPRFDNYSSFYITEFFVLSLIIINL